MGSFNSLVKGLGVAEEKSYLMSKNLTQLTYDLSSFKNLDFDTAFRKLQSAMSGEIEPLRNVGVALSQATLQQLAYSNLATEFKEAIAPFSSLPCIGLAPGANGSPLCLPSGVEPVFEPYTTFDVIVNTDIVGSAFL